MLVSKFFRLVLPDEGFLFAATLGTKGGWWNNACSDIPELVAQSREWANGNKDVYFALASYKEERVWNPTKRDWKTKQNTGGWERRTQDNVKYLRSLYLDLDVKANAYATQADAIVALRAFCKTVGLPKPTLVNSGYGIHVYWPLTANVEPDEWKATAEKLKSCCVALGLKADHSLTTDSARVLRVPNTMNRKRGGSAPVQVISDCPARALAGLDAILTRYVAGNNVPVAAGRAVAPLPAGVAPPTVLQGNLGATNDPANGNLVVWHCPAMAKLVNNRGATAKFPQWLAGLAVARFCDQPGTMMRAVSDGHPGYDETTCTEKFESLSRGPAKCTTFWAEDNATCEACPHWQKIKTPVEMGRIYRQTPPTIPAGAKVIEVAPPWPYMRLKRDDGSTHVIFRKKEDDTVEDIEVLPYDLFPTRIMDNHNDDDEHDERSVWVAMLPRTGRIEFAMPQTMLGDTRKLHGFLLSRGLHVNVKHAKATQFYMTAYLGELAKAVDRERMYERLGWHETRKQYVLPDVIYHRDGSESRHQASRALEAATKSALHVEGTFEAWYEHTKFYCPTPYYASRFNYYCAFGSPILHMTGQKGVLVAASGNTGRGKTTTLEGAASIYGNPSLMLVGGGSYGSTINATFAMLGTFHSLPFFWDDTTERDPEEMRQFLLHISTGRGKDRMYGKAHDGKIVTWEAIVLSSANTDDVYRIMATGKDSDPHLMRFISVPFDAIDNSTEAKLHADQFRRGIHANFGHAGRIHLKYLAQNYEAVYPVVLRAMEGFDRLIGATSEERHWSGTLAAAFVGARIAHNLGLIPFDPRDDKQWFVDQAKNMRVTYKQAASTPADILNEFIEGNVSHTLILSPKQSSHVDNIVQKPVGELLIRNEVDNERIYIARNALISYCNKVKANFRMLEVELKFAKIILRRDCYKVLGADTPMSAGQTRCWEIDRVALEAYKRRK